MKKIALGAISLYQVALSPFYGLSGPGSTCRFHPSCSSYGREAIEKYGAMKGGWLTMKRISRCNPFRQGGFDPVL